MNPEFDQDDLNIEDFLYTCFNNKNKQLKVELDAYKIFNKTLVSVFQFYNYYETANDNGDFDGLPGQTASANNTAFNAIQNIYFFIPVFSDAKTCQELQDIIQQNLSVIQTYFSALPLVTNKGLLNAQDILTTLENNFYEFENVIETICQDVLDIE
tara:strand:+ start:2596 stop:3063 length:468 start_codon:yes stop_codon:yes gene_type:complete